MSASTFGIVTLRGTIRADRRPARTGWIGRQASMRVLGFGTYDAERHPRVAHPARRAARARRRRGRGQRAARDQHRATHRDGQPALAGLPAGAAAAALLARSAGPAAPGYGAATHRRRGRRLSRPVRRAAGPVAVPAHADRARPARLRRRHRRRSRAWAGRRIAPPVAAARSTGRGGPGGRPGRRRHGRAPRTAAGQAAAHRRSWSPSAPPDAWPRAGTHRVAGRTGRPTRCGSSSSDCSPRCRGPR